MGDSKPLVALHSVDVRKRTETISLLVYETGSSYESGFLLVKGNNRQQKGAFLLVKEKRHRFTVIALPKPLEAPF
jgi:hypothetical protein